MNEKRIAKKIAKSFKMKKAKKSLYEFYDVRDKFVRQLRELAEEVEDISISEDKIMDLIHFEDDDTQKKSRMLREAIEEFERDAKKVTSDIMDMVRDLNIAVIRAGNI